MSFSILEIRKACGDVVRILNPTSRKFKVSPYVLCDQIKRIMEGKLLSYGMLLLLFVWCDSMKLLGEHTPSTLTSDSKSLSNTEA